MGPTLWVLQKTRIEDGYDWDHSLFYESYEALDELATQLGVRKMSNFFDDADLRFNMSDEELPES